MTIPPDHMTISRHTSHDHGVYITPEIHRPVDNIEDQKRNRKHHPGHCVYPTNAVKVLESSLSLLFDPVRVTSQQTVPELHTTVLTDAAEEGRGRLE